MSSFIKLNSLIINANDICFIEKPSYNNKTYIIRLKNDVLEGHSIITPGEIQITKNVIKISKHFSESDYIILDEWVKELK
jgi:hypothetical protein